MITFPKRLKVILTQAAIRRAWHFANKVVVTVNYTDSNQYNRQKIRYDHFMSKLGEEAVYAAFSFLGQSLVLTPPDYMIYKGNQKSWQADLYVNGVPLAVKTQSVVQAQKYGLSWTFQCASTRKDPILQESEYWVCFVACESQKKGYPCYVYPPKQIKQLVFGEPILPYLKGKKKVVYAKQNFNTID